MRSIGYVVLVSMLLCACGGPPVSAEPPDASSGEVLVFAASSLTEAFTEIGESFESANPGMQITFNFAGSSTLRTQLEQGARADVFASANQAQMDALEQAGLVSGNPTPFATNRLAIITPAGRDAVTTIEDLAKPGVRLVIALPDVPVGGYAQEALDKMDGSGRFGAGFAEDVLANVVSEETNVRQVAAKVALGEADAGIVYATDVTPDIADSVTTIGIPDEFNVVALYPIAVLAHAPNAQGAQGFVDYVLSPDGQAILASYGFGGAG